MPIVPTQTSTSKTVTPAQARMLAQAQQEGGSSTQQAINATSLPGAVAGGQWYDGPDWRGFLWTPTYTIGHSGNDIGMPLGTPLTALIPGKVISLGMEPWGGQINLQSTYPGIGPIVISYLHESSFARGMAPGVDVLPGELIGYSGQPPPGGPYGSGPHCHFEVNTGYQPPYMGHQGPPSPIDSLFLIEAARAGTLGQLGTYDPLSGSGGSPVQTIANWLGIPSFSLGTGAVSRAPLSPGFLGVVEEMDESMSFVSFDSENILGWAGANIEAAGIRLTIIMLGVIIMLIVFYNAMKPAIEREAQIAGPLITAAATGAL